MIWMLLLLFKKESSLTAPFATCLLSLLVQSTLQWRPFTRSQTAHVFECEQVTRQATQAKDIVFYINGIALDNETEFKYLGHIISADDWDDAAVLYKIKKAMKAWYGMQHILSANSADPHTMACFYLAVVQAKLLFGSETWVLSEHILGPLE